MTSQTLLKPVTRKVMAMCKGLVLVLGLSTFIPAWGEPYFAVRRGVKCGLLWEYTPMQFVQLRVGLREYDGDRPQNELTFAFLQLNAYF